MIFVIFDDQFNHSAFPLDESCDNSKSEGVLIPKPILFLIDYVMVVQKVVGFSMNTPPDFKLF